MKNLNRRIQQLENNISMIQSRVGLCDFSAMSVEQLKSFCDDCLKRRIESEEGKRFKEKLESMTTVQLQSFTQKYLRENRRRNRLGIR